MRSTTYGFLAALALTAVGCGGEIGDGPDTTGLGLGSGAPSGAHFDLNVIGVSNPKDATKTSGRVIFVPLQGSCQIQLAQGDFAVLDGNCTDGTAAQFQLPNPDPAGTGITTYSVFARALGKPGGSSTLKTCATDVATGELFCSVDALVSTRTKGQQTFTNVSKQLLFVSIIDSTGKLVRLPLFDASLQDFFWQYDNNGLRLLQMRFYDVSTNVN